MHAPPSSHSYWFIAFIKLLVANQMWYASRLHQQVRERKPRVQYMRLVFVIPEWHGDLWSVKSSCLWRILAFTSVFPVFISVALVTHCPCKPWNGSVSLVANEWKVFSPFLRRETKLWMRNRDRMGKWVTVLCHCGTYFITPHKGRPVLQFKGEGSLVRFSFTFEDHRMKMH